MGKVLPGVSELRERDKDFWYRVLYALYSGWIYVLHCFKKKTNETAQNDINLAKERFARVKSRVKVSGKEEKRA